MDKVTEENNNLSKELITTADSASFVRLINQSTGKAQNITLANLAKLVADINVQSDTDLPSGGVYASVDLGLPSGTLWATHNIGATKPEEYGDLFAWGATEPYRLNGTTPIDNTDNYAKSYANTIQHDLYPNEDVATVKWGKGWIMPTKAQFEELLANTTNAWTTQNGINGRKFTASNGNSIFFPAAGYVDGGSLYYRGSGGYFWSRTRDSATGAWRLGVDSGGAGMYDNNRLNGFSVRPVRG